jgi:CRISPR-associated protein Cas2
MSLHQSTQWLVTYDISDPKRLAHVFRYLKKKGIPIQYSVFSVTASSAQMGTLMAGIATLIHKGQDDVRAYRLPIDGWRATLGEDILPKNLWLA